MKKLIALALLLSLFNISCNENTEGLSADEVKTYYNENGFVLEDNSDNTSTDDSTTETITNNCTDCTRTIQDFSATIRYCEGSKGGLFIDDQYIDILSYDEQIDLLGNTCE